MVPSLYQYLNYRDYLRDYYAWKKAENPAFSFQKMAWKAGFRSKSFFSEVMAGKKNISPTSVFSVAKALDLEGEAFSYFEALVTFTQARTQAEKSHCFRILVQFHKRGKAQLVARDQFEVYSKWYHNTIRELVTLMDFKEDYSVLGRLVKPAISDGKARASVKLLLRLGLLVLENGRYRQTNQSITTGEEIKAVAVGNFHIQNMDLAAASVDTCPSEERDISCLVAGLSPAGFATLKSEIQDFRKKLVEIIRNDAPATRVYHINFQLYPTSETTDACPKPENTDGSCIPPLAPAHPGQRHGLGPLRTIPCGRHVGNGKSPKRPVSRLQEGYHPIQDHRLRIQSRGNPHPYSPGKTGSAQ